MKKVFIIPFILLLGAFVKPSVYTSALSSPINIEKLSVGSAHGLLLTEENEIYAFGNRFNGSFGDGDVTNGVVNRLIKITNSGDFATADFVTDPIKKIEANNTMSAILTNAGNLYLWGNNETGSVGNGTFNHQYTPLLATNFGELNNLAAEDLIVDVSLNSANNLVFALSSTGRLFVWGAVRNGLSGEGSTEFITAPKEMTSSGDLINIESPDKIVAISAGNSTPGVVSSAGKVFTWGWNSFARALGTDALGTQSVRTTPIEITTSGALGTLSALNDKVVDIDMNQFSGLVKTQEGRYIVWGLNAEGQGGQQTRGQYILPVIISISLDDINNETIVDVYSGGGSYLALTSLGNIYTWGWNNNGSLGNGTNDGFGLLGNPINSVGILSNLNAGEYVTTVSKQSLTTIAITNEQRLIGWGPNGSKVFFGSNLPTTNTPVDLMEAVTNALKEPYVFVIDSIDAFPEIDSMTLTNQNEVEAARAAYDALSLEEKALVTNLASLEAAEAKIAELAQAALDQASADAVIALINSLPDLNGLTLADATAITAARDAYGALNPQAQALVSNLPALEAAEAKLAELNQAVLDQANADEVIAMIASLVEVADLTLADAETIEAARNAYLALNEDAQALVTNLDKLLDLDEALLALFGAIDDVKNMIDAFPILNTMTLADEDDVLAARAAYDALSEEQQGLVTNYADLEAAEERITELKAIAAVNQAAAQLIIDEIGALPSVETLTLDDELAVLDAVAAYEALTAEQKILVTNYAKLQALVVQLEVLNQPSISLSFAWILLLLIPIAFAGYYYRRQWLPLVINRSTTKHGATDAVQNVATVNSIQLDAVNLSDVQSRHQFQAFSKVSAGSYLEITSGFASTNRVVEVQDTLPKTLNESNRFIAISKEEVKMVKLSLTSGVAFIKKTPGSYIDQDGYYVEVDLKNNLVDNFIFARTRLAPTTTKGHRWIRIETRKMESK
jgi:alpha-tubulin suppressor-like RCC1 family protein